MSHAPRRAVVAAVVLPLALSGAFAGSAEAKTRKPTCEVGNQWVRSTPGFEQTDAVEEVNREPTTLSLEFISTVTGTVAIEASASVEVSTEAGFGAFSAGVKAQLGIRASKSVTVEKGVKLTVPVRPKRRTVVRFGAATRKLRGYRVVDPNNLQDLDILLEGMPLPKVPGMPAGCSLRSAGVITANVPIGSGHRTRSYALRRKK